MFKKLFFFFFFFNYIISANNIKLLYKTPSKKKVIRAYKQLKKKGMTNLKIVKQKKSKIFKLIQVLDEDQVETSVPWDWSYVISPYFHGGIPKQYDDDQGNEINTQDAWFGGKVKTEGIKGDYSLQLAYQSDWGVESNTQTHIEDFEETQFTISFDNSTVKVGYMSFLWGKLDESSSFHDHIPQDYTRFITTDLAKRALGSPGLFWELQGEEWLFESFIVQNKKSILPKESSKWSSFNRQEGRFINNELDSTLTGLLQSSGIREFNKEGLDAGLRLGRSFNDLDFTLIALRYTRPFPYLLINQDVIQDFNNGGSLPLLFVTNKEQFIWLKNEEINKGGFDFAYSQGPNIFRGELSYGQGFFTTKSNFIQGESDRVDYGLSWERDFLDGNLKLLWQLNGARLMEDKATYIDKRDAQAASLFIQYTIKEEMLDIEARIAEDIAAKGNYTRVSLLYRPQLNTTLKLEYHSFSGPDGQGLGFFKKNDYFLLGMNGTY
jgi:hypothetical protein